MHDSFSEFSYIENVFLLLSHINKNLDEHFGQNIFLMI